MLKNYLKAVAKKGFKKKEDVLTSNIRTRICLSCDSLNRKNNSCKECGCSISLLSFGENSDCSLNKWENDKDT
jgi:ribosomal protein L32